MTDADAMLDREEARKVVSGDAPNLFALLGRQPVRDGWALRAWAPGAEAVTAVARDDGRELGTLERGPEDGLFHAAFRELPPNYRLKCRRGADEWEIDDPYQYGPVLGEQDEHYLAEGSHLRIWTKLGAHPMEHEGSKGTLFSVWAPNARRVSVVGDFNDWDGRRHVMRPRGATGVWEIFIPNVGEGWVYKYEIKGPDGAVLPLKADPLGFGSEHPPANASIVRNLGDRMWKDQAWLEARKARNQVDAPISIYEMHTTSWRRGPDGRTLTWRELGETLVPYVKEMGYTHIETLPISEYPFDGSWGYQPVGMYAPTSRHGDVHDFRAFVEMVHEAGLGLIIDWVPAHFPTDAHGLARFDGTPLYEHGDPREGFHMDWNTYIYNFGRREVSNYLVANALYWLKEHHVDGLRVDAVASMLYRDYSRKADEWVPNRFGGRENLEAIDFLKRMNEVVYGEDDSVVTIAEESTAWPGVSKPVFAGGLGFGYKWNMGWMHDTLEYVQKDPLYRRHHHHQMTFGLIYAFSENFILPISHDEVVHGKGSMYGKMPGDEWQKFANLRAYYTFMWTHPGKKLLFMGQEFGQRHEWNHDAELDWGALQDPKHAGLQALVKDLNHLYRETPALHEKDCEGDGFQWIEGNASDESVYAYARFGKGTSKPVIAVLNFTPTPRHGYRIGVPAAGRWRVRLNSDDPRYGGSGVGQGDVESRPEPAQGRSDSLELSLPPLGALILEQAE